jgi:hypothetical protein
MKCLGIVLICIPFLVVGLVAFTHWTPVNHHAAFLFCILCGSFGTPLAIKDLI